MSRETTNKLLEMLDEGVLDARTLALACLKYMSEDEVEDMAKANEFVADLEEEEKSYPYIINAGDELDDLCPLFASESKEKAIELCKSNKFYKYLEVVYMPEDDIDTNDVVWRSWEVK
jgi:hypothetical protein